MTREEAIERLNIHKSTSVFVDSIAEAIDMAIEALSSAEVQAKCIAEIKVDAEDIYTRITGLVADKVDVVRCKDCKHWHSNTEFCGIWSFQNIAQRTLSDDYCSRAERREP